MFPLSILFVAFVVSGYSNSIEAGQNKPYRLSLLGLMSFVETDPTYRTSCSTAAQIVVETVNARSDILPDYEIVLQIKNEGPDASIAPKSFVNFIRSFEGPVINNTYPSPIVAGPTAACQSVALAIRAANYTAFSAGCGGVYLVANRKLFSTLYRILMPIESTVMSVLKFGLEIGKWKQIGIVSYSGNPNNFLQGELLYDQAIRNGYKVLFYSSEADFTLELMQNVKASGARFVVYAMGSPVTHGVNFLCNAYFAGMTAPRYIFAFFFIAYFVPNAQTPIPKGCSLEIVKEQFKIVFWFGAYNLAIQNNGPSDFGYDLTTYESRFAELLKNRTVTDRDRTHLCHDSFMATILTLNKSETILKERYNMSLRDFQTNPEIVGKLVNNTATTLDFTGLRIGRVSYSNRFEVDGEAQWIMQNLNGKDVIVYRVTRLNFDREAIFNLSLYNQSLFQAPRWFTKTGQPPKDLSQIQHQTIAYSMTSFAIIIGFAAFSQLLLSLVIALAFQLKDQAPFLLVSDSFFNAALYFGCSFSNVAAVLLMIEAAYFPGGVCSIRPLFTVLGTTVINVLLMLRMNAFSQLIKKAKRASKSRTATTGTNKRNTSGTHQGGDSSTATSFHVPAHLTFITFMAFSTATLVIWLVVHPFSVEYNVTPLAFDEIADVYFDITTRNCVGENQASWMAAFILANVLILFLACFFAYGSRKTSSNSPIIVDFECTLVRVCVTVTTTLFGAVLLLTFIVGSHVANQLTVIAVGNLLYSLVNCLTPLLPAWTRKWPSVSVTSSVVGFTTGLTGNGNSSSAANIRSVDVRK